MAVQSLVKYDPLLRACFYFPPRYVRCRAVLGHSYTHTSEGEVLRVRDLELDQG